MLDLADRIQAVLKKRREHLPAVQKEIERWQALDGGIAALGLAVQELQEHPRTPLELKDALRGFQVHDLRRRIADAIRLLRVVESRFMRSTINIGVSGVARVGKSTLLQSISGLSDAQIPVGKGDPVTAVRSRIFHSRNQRATVRLHTFESFRDQVLRPYAQVLGLNGVPDSLAAFRNWAYPRSEAELPEDCRTHSNGTMLKRLLDMQRTLPSYQDDLTGGERQVGLEEIRPFVAYPTEDDGPRRYLAVCDVRIECCFPRIQVESLGIIDLPGLGEIAADAEAYHLSGLQDEVDLVVLVKRPVEGMAFWKTEDGKTANLLDRARGSVKNRRDFVFVLINSGEADPDLCANLRKSVHELANGGEDAKNFRILEADAADQVSVEKHVLVPLLNHLAERLPIMDQEVLEGTRSDDVALKSMISTTMKDLETLLARMATVSGSATEDLDLRTVEMRKDLAASLGELVRGLQVEARSGDEDPDYLKVIEAAYQGICSWISNGFGVGREAWPANALRTMRVDRNSSPFAALELNRIRVEISGKFCRLDDYFSSRVDWLWDRVAEILQKDLGDLARSVDGSIDGEAVLKRLSGLMAEASEPCPALRGALDDLLALHLEYRTHLHPHVRSELDGLNLQVKDPETGQPVDQIVVDVNESGAEELLLCVTQLAEQAAYRTKKALVAKAVTPALVLHAAAEQFDDAFIRSGDSEREFKRLARSYRDEIWPGVFQGMDGASARFAKVTRTIRAVREDLDVTK
jgi:hypothetical protein